MFRSNPNREFLNIELMTDPAARDCLEDILASVISWWGRRYELMFASSWSFDFKPGSGELVGPRLDAEISPALDLLETHHGISDLWGYPFNRSASRPPSVFGRRPPRPVCPWAFQARGMPSPFGAARGAASPAVGWQ